MTQKQVDLARQQGTFAMEGLDLEDILEAGEVQASPRKVKKEKEPPAPASPAMRAHLVPWDGELGEALRKLPRKPVLSYGDDGHRVTLCNATLLPIHSYVSLPLPTKKNGFQCFGTFLDNNVALAHLHTLREEEKITDEECAHHAKNLAIWVGNRVVPSSDPRELSTRGGKITDIGLFMSGYAQYRDVTGCKPVFVEKVASGSSEKAGGPAQPKKEHFVLRASMDGKELVPEENDEGFASIEAALKSFGQGSKCLHVGKDVWIVQSNNLVLPKQVRKVLRSQFGVEVSETATDKAETSWHVVAPRRTREKAVEAEKKQSIEAELKIEKEKKRKRKEKEKAAREKVAAEKAALSKKKAASPAVKRRKTTPTSSDEGEQSAEGASPVVQRKQARKQAEPKRSLTKKTGNKRAAAAH